MKKNNKHKATLILVVFTLGFLISYPFSKNNFWVGLISGACGASMIGGLADWFAVTAIFRRPLGLYWPRKIFRTEIIPRNRDSIINGLVDIIENELLSKESIKKKVLDINLYGMLIKYLEENSKNGELNAFFITLVNDYYKSLSCEKVNTLLNGSLEMGLQRFDASTFLAQFIVFLRDNNYDNEIIDFTLDMFIGFIKHSKTHLFFTNFVEKVIAEYENGSSSRAMTIKMLLNFVLKKSPSDLAALLETNIVNAIYLVKNEDNENRLKIKKSIDGLSNSLSNDFALRNVIEKFKLANIDKVNLLSKELTSIFANFKDKNTDIIGTDMGLRIDKVFQDALDNVINSSIKNSEKFDMLIKDIIINLVNKKHNTIGAIVKDRINQFSTEELVQLIEGVAGNDLQMIRINGSVVGGIVGILTYLLTYSIR